MEEQFCYEINTARDFKFYITAANLTEATAKAQNTAEKSNPIKSITVLGSVT